MEEGSSLTSDEYIYYMQVRMIAEQIIDTAKQIEISGKPFLHSDVRKSHEAVPYSRTKQGILLEMRNTSIALLSIFGSWQILTFAPEKTFKTQLIKKLSKHLEITLVDPKEPPLYAITKIKWITLPAPELDKIEVDKEEYLKSKWKAMTEKYNKEYAL